jgi:hypothetical protein
VEPYGHECFADNPSFFDQPQVREVEPVEFPVKVKDNAKEKEDEKGGDIAGTFKPSIHDPQKRTGKEKI